MVNQRFFAVTPEFYDNVTKALESSGVNPRDLDNLQVALTVYMAHMLHVEFCAGTLSHDEITARCDCLGPGVRSTVEHMIDRNPYGSLD